MEHDAKGSASNKPDTNATIHIWRARTTNTDGSATIGATKTPGSIRTLEAPQVVLDALEHHRQRQDKHAESPWDFRRLSVLDMKESNELSQGFESAAVHVC